MWAEFTKRGATAIAISQEDKELESASRFLAAFKEGVPDFPIVADFNRDTTKRYDRTTTYLIDPEGVVRQIFPNVIHKRAAWTAALHELDRLQAADAPTTRPDQP